MHGAAYIPDMGQATTTLDRRREKDDGRPTANGGRYSAEVPPEDTTVTLSLDDDGSTRPVNDDTEPDYIFEPVRSYTVPDTKLATAIMSIERANNRLAKAGIEERFTYETEESVRNIDGQLHAVVTITLNQPKIRFEGWTFTGAHDFTPDGSVISHISGQDVPPVTDTHCDHCNTTRRRERVYTLRHAEQGDVQVGKSCLAAFLGIKPEGLWALEYDVEERDPEDPDEAADYFRGGSQVYPAGDLIAATLAASNGGETFLSKNSASFDQTPTAYVVLSDWDRFTTEQLDAHRAQAQEIRDWVDSIPVDSDVEYLRNLRAALSGPSDKYVKKQHVALAASAVSAYRKAKDRDAEKAAREKTRQSFAAGFVAPVKERVRGVGATILRSNSFESYYGTTTAITMVTDDGHQVTWFASGAKSPTIGQKVKFDATVKEHGEYDGADQTLITRAKIVDDETGDPLQ